VKKILVVDDDLAMGEMCKELLKSKGYTSDVVSSGKEAIEKVFMDGCTRLCLPIWLCLIWMV